MSGAPAEQTALILTALEGLRYDLRGDLARIDTDLGGLKTDFAGLKTDVAGLKTDLADLKTEFADLKTDVAVLKTDVAVLKTDVAVLKTDVADVKTDVAGLKTDAAHRGAEITELRVVMMERMDRLQNTLAATREDMIVNFAASNSVRESVDSTRNELRSLHEMVATIWRQLKGLEARVRELTGDP